MVEPTAEIRPFREGDEKGINRLFNQIFAAARTLEEWNWKFRENPTLNGPPDAISLIEKNGEIAGHYASITLLVKYRGKTIRAIQVVDTFVDRSARVGIKSLRALYAAHLERVAAVSTFGFGFPNDKAYPVGKKLLGYRDLGEMVQLFKCLSLKGAVKKRCSRAPNWLLDLVHAVSRRFFRTPVDGKARYTLDSTGAVDRALDRLWDRIENRLEIAVLRTSAYLNWRYKGDRGQFLVARQEREVCGYAVVKIEDTDQARVGKILDLLYDGEDAASFLLAGALRLFSDRGADFALCGCLNSSPLEHVLRRNGFIDKKGIDPFPVVYLPFTDESDPGYLTDPANWHLAYGDVDGF